MVKVVEHLKNTTVIKWYFLIIIQYAIKLLISEKKNKTLSIETNLVPQRYFKTRIIGRTLQLIFIATTNRFVRIIIITPQTPIPSFDTKIKLSQYENTYGTGTT